jgi:hypothetical protein
MHSRLLGWAGQVVRRFATTKGGRITSLLTHQAVLPRAISTSHDECFRNFVARERKASLYIAAIQQVVLKTEQKISRHSMALEVISTLRTCKLRTCLTSEATGTLCLLWTVCNSEGSLDLLYVQYLQDKNTTCWYQHCAFACNARFD